MKHYVLCLVDTDDEAQEITRRVVNAGFGKEEIFVLSSDRMDSNNSTDRRKEEPGLFNEGVGLLAASGSTMVGGTGSFVGVGKMMDAAGRDELAVEEGNAAAFLASLGLSEAAEREYLKRLSGGASLVAVQIDDRKLVAAARTIFEEAHAEEIFRALG
jgi:hypothetical protein